MRLAIAWPWRLARDLPLDRDETARFLPWIVAFIVFLAALALAATLVVGEAVSAWNRGLSDALTVQVPPPQRADPPALQQRIDTVLAALRGMPAVAVAEPVPEARVRALLEPWLGSAAAFEALPLPALIEVRLRDPEKADLGLMKRQLEAIAPDISVDSHRLWLDALTGRVRWAQIIALGVVLLNALAAVGTVVFATRTGLMVHLRIIEVLHLMGATDRYIARQFAMQALRLGLRGGVIGIVPALLALVLLTRVGGDWAGGEIGGWLGPDVALRPWQWACLLLVPLVTAAIAVATAWRTVMRTLEKLP
ncbi:MAG: cell division protein FtsX [Reyranellaceae bacterium]